MAYLMEFILMQGGGGVSPVVGSLWTFSAIWWLSIRIRKIFVKSKNNIYHFDTVLSKIGSVITNNCFNNDCINGTFVSYDFELFCCIINMNV